MRISGSFEPKKEQCGRVKRPNTAYAGCFFIITKVISDVYAAEKQGFKPLDPFHKLTNYALFLRYDSKMSLHHKSNSKVRWSCSGKIDYNGAEIESGCLPSELNGYQI